ncbi:murein transglycosylase A [Aurantimonas sp. VKM B-3413]|uniref:murein transglycosylase A n=1 Tax=Aurantimonas sp. VKM B-3413 TaxID=2779401 RepID=UPI001E471155|nr:MltA domain-containing protein [Aurantimonas sp. VKM B-3413]MCB8840590.1 MltA domain-containing protein [Aurantimonas sp. VKM B-3413]
MTAFVRRSLSDLSGWQEADHALAFAAFRRSAERLRAGAFPTGSLGIAVSDYAEAAEAALASGDLAGPQAREFFERAFVPLRIVPEGADGPLPGFVTGYYEPVVDASPVRTEHFRFPLYQPPDDLVKIDDDNRPFGFDPSFRFARRLPDGDLVEYPDRAAIENGFLAGRGLEIAWLDDAVEAFLIHVQGSARLRFAGGHEVRVGYAAKTGHEFTAIGRVLIERGELTRVEADMDGIRAWLASHPDEVRPLLHRNRSFIFFREFPVEDPGLGPVGAAKVPLTALASIAVDRLLATYGVPYFISAPELLLDSSPLRRLMIAQDTGSAILGPARADIFIGSGPVAGAVAGRIRHAADFTLFVPPALAERLAE